MGLDIAVYKNVAPATIDIPSDVLIDCGGNLHDWASDNGYHILGDSDLNLNHALKSALYTATLEDFFHFGSYSSYNIWRNDLCLSIHEIHDEQFWDNHEEYKDKSFYELINFSDCSGALNHQACVDLYKDFEQHLKKIQSLSRNLSILFKDKYILMMNAFKIAAENNGVIEYC